MKIIMPLFSFQYDDFTEFEFSDGKLSIRHFESWEGLADSVHFSELDRMAIQHANKALVSSDLNEYEEDASLLLMAFRLLAEDNKITPIIMYRLCENPNDCSRLDGVEVHNDPNGYYQVYSASDFTNIDKTYMLLRNGFRNSPRLHNAFYFLYRAFNSLRWVDGILFYMGVLEALFSWDSTGPAKKPVCETAAKMLGNNWTQQAIEEMYDVRSRISHGRLEAGRNKEDNLNLLAKMEILTKLCIRHLIELDAFQHYSRDPNTRIDFLLKINPDFNKKN